MKRAIVVGSGAGGATVARELQGAFDVLVLEAGGDFRRFGMGLSRLERLKRAGLLIDERETPMLYAAMRIRKTREGMVLVRGVGTGGTTTICTGNALRMDEPLKELGIDLDDEFAEIRREIPIGAAHRDGWRTTTQRLFEICREMELAPFPAPKFGDYAACRHCGRCVFGCPAGVKWDSRVYLRDAVGRGAELRTRCRVRRVVVRNGRAVGVEASSGRSSHVYPADLVVLAAGGLATPVILQDSGIACEPSLFVDPVLCVAAEVRDCRQCFEVQMPFIVQREGFIVAPYFDHLSFCFNRAWRYPAPDIAAIMIKLADTNVGRVTRRGVEKALGAEDRARLARGVGLAKEILHRFGAKDGGTFLGTLNAGHPGGTLPLSAREAASLHHDRLPENLYVADATLLPRSLGNPPSLTIIAMAKRVAKLCRQGQA